jgi:DNA (cytosine-5)-methyltransferase 1
MKARMNKLKAVDFFCSGGGMSAGLKDAGIDVLAGIDFDPECKDTYEENISGSKFILADVFDLRPIDLEKKLGIQPDDNDLVLIGCSPCQYWSIIRTNKAKSLESKNLLKEFHRFVKHFNPGYVVVENVPGILRRCEESGLVSFIEDLESRGYKVHSEVVNLNEFGVPENRKRFSLVANRVTESKVFPTRDTYRPTVKDFIGVGNGFPKVLAGHKDQTDFLHSVAGLSDKNITRLKMTPANGGSRSSWADTNLQLEAYKKKDSKVSFSDTYGRMSWDKPAPTITTKFFSISNGRFAHPEEDRAISLREGATLQTFSKDYKFIGTSISSIARMIGNAVPPQYAKKIGQSIVDNHGTRTTSRT